VTPEEKQKLKALYVGTALYYGQDIPDLALKLYVEDLQDLPIAEVERAMQEIRRDPKNNRCPLPATIRGRLQPSIAPELEAEHLVGLIVEAIRKVGPYRLPELPAVAMEVIRLEGWEQICGAVTDGNLATYKAQWRRLATALLMKQRSPGEDLVKLEGASPIDVKGLLPEFPEEDPK
jgi:hypothetical protein